MAEGGMTEEAVTAAADVVEHTYEEMVRVVHSTKVKFALLGAAGGISTGAVLGFIVAYKKAEKKYETLAEEEISQMREHYRDKAIAAEPKPSIDEVTESLGYATKVAPVVDSPIITEEDEIQDAVDAAETNGGLKNVFEENAAEDVWNYEEEMANRTPEAPYVIHKEEFDQGNFQGDSHEQATLTYFADDDILADERDSQIKHMDELVGLENLEKFGHGSDDANVVYVRNHKVRVDFEIVRSGGSYAAEVHGVSEEEDLEHSAMRRHRPLRRFDDD